jgi:16S rRNA (cytosine967-C5)-methyltransferase
MVKAEKSLNARAAAFLALRQIEREDAYANIALKQVLNQYRLPVEEARLAAQITYGTTRMRLALDYILQQFLKKPLEDLMPEQKTILRLSLYQLHYMETIDYAAVNEGVILTKKYASPKLSGLTNAVLRNYLRAQKCKLLPEKEDDLAAYLNITLSFPNWLVDYLLDHYLPEEAEAFCHYANSHKGIAIRANTLKTTREELIAHLAETNVDAVVAGYAPESLCLSGELGNLACQTFFQKGDFIVQGLSSQLVAHALSPCPGSRVLDLCAAPGGKATHLAALMENRGEVHAFDVHPHKMDLLKSNAERLGITIIQSAIADSCQLPAFYQKWADYILLDAPCSGLGVLGTRADSRFRKEIAAIDELADLSYSLLEAATAYLKPGGKLCYATCTITEEENTKNISRFLTKHPDFSLSPLTGLMPFMPKMHDDLQSGEIQLLPFRGDREMEGFYIALLEKHQ